MIWSGVSSNGWVIFLMYSSNTLSPTCALAMSKTPSTGAGSSIRCGATVATGGSSAAGGPFVDTASGGLSAGITTVVATGPGLFDSLAQPTDTANPATMAAASTAVCNLVFMEITTVETLRPLPRVSMTARPNRPRPTGQLPSLPTCTRGFMIRSPIASRGTSPASTRMDRIPTPPIHRRQVRDGGNRRKEAQKPQEGE